MSTFETKQPQQQQPIRKLVPFTSFEPRLPPNWKLAERGGYIYYYKSAAHQDRTQTRPLFQPATISVSRTCKRQLWLYEYCFRLLAVFVFQTTSFTRAAGNVSLFCVVSF